MTFNNLRKQLPKFINLEEIVETDTKTKKSVELLLTDF